MIRAFFLALLIVAGLAMACGPASANLSPNIRFASRATITLAGPVARSIRSRLQHDGSIDDPVEAADQHRNKSRKRPEQKRGRRCL